MRRLSIASFILSVLAATVSAPSVARAQALSAQDEANARFQTGLKYYDAHDFESARLAFTQAYAVLQKPSILLNLALSETYSNHLVDAIGHLEQFIKDPTTPADKREKAKKHLDDALKKTGHLQIQTSSDAEVKLDNRVLTPPFALVHVTPGAHSLEARLAGKTKTANAEARAGETTVIDLAFEGEAPTAPVASSSSTTNASSPAFESRPFTAPPEEMRERSSATRWIVPASLGLAALGGFAVGLGFASAHDGTIDEADALRRAAPSNMCADRSSASCRAYEDKLADATRQSTISTVGYVAGGALLAGAVATFIFWPRATSKTGAVVVRPTLGSTVGGAIAVAF